MYLSLIILLPFLFLIGVIYNSIKEQKRLENSQMLKQILQKRKDKERLPKGHPDRKYQKYDDDDDY